jgi:1-acyl-sn-glycerol-3-phosphate acyltransferase
MTGQQQPGNPAALENVGVRFEITGLDNLKSFEGPAVFIANHMSTLETFVLPPSYSR